MPKLNILYHRNIKIKKLFPEVIVEGSHQTIIKLDLSDTC